MSGKSVRRDLNGEASVLGSKEGLGDMTCNMIPLTMTLVVASTK